MQVNGPGAQDPEATSTTHQPRLQVPRQTTPTWEIELLLSGAVVFALFQVPGAVQDWADAASARTGAGGDMVVRMAYVYALMVNYALIGMFLVHLTARAYWVALVGIDSVYPDGIRWERYRQGPIARREAQRYIGSIPSLVERADNFASLCFTFGLLVVMSAVLGASYAMPATLIALLVSEYVFDGQHLMQVLNVSLGLVLLPTFAAAMIDQRLKRRGGDDVPDTRLHRWTGAVYRMRINRLPAPLMLMLSTNLRGRRAYVLFFAALLLLMTVLLAEVFARAGVLRLDGYDYLPADEMGQSADLRHYRDARTIAADDMSPSIASMLATGDYLQLVVPYRPERFNPMIERHCTASPAEAQQLSEALQADPSAQRRTLEQRVLDCMRRQLDIRLDGSEPGAVDLVFSTDPGTGLRALMAVVPIRDLATGRHELTLARIPRASVWDDPDALAEHRAEGPVRIAFWR